VPLNSWWWGIEGKRRFKGTKCRWEGNIEINLKEAEWRAVNWIHPA
jgi:hypothetical protein